MDIHKAKDITKLVKTAVRTMVNDVKAERAMVVLLSPSQRRPTPAGQFGFAGDDIWNDASINQRVLKQIMQQPKTVFVLDSHNDTQFRSTSAHRAVLCVPLGDVGFLYCDHSNPGGLDHSSRRTVEELANGFIRRHSELTEPQATAIIEDEGPVGFKTLVDEPALRSNMGMLVLMVIIVIATLVAVIYFSG